MTSNSFTRLAQLVTKSRALVYRSHGLPSAELSLEEGHLTSESMKDKDDLVLVKMLASPINPSAINQIEGRYPLSLNPDTSQSPPVPGLEGVGEIVATEGQASLHVGDWVIPQVSGLGMWREYLITSPSHLFKVPKSLSLEAAATLLTNPPTAYRLLHDYALPMKASCIVQNGANSAVGRCVIEMAAKLGIKTINIIRDRSDYGVLEAELQALGATVVVKAETLHLSDTQNYIKDTLGLRPSLAFNCVGGSGVTEMSKLLEEGSTVITYGAMSGKPVALSAAQLIFKDIRHVGFWLTRWYGQAENAEKRNAMIADLAKWYAEGSLHLPPFDRFDFVTQWNAAVDYYSQPHNLTNNKPLFIFDHNQ